MLGHLYSMLLWLLSCAVPGADSPEAGAACVRCALGDANQYRVEAELTVAEHHVAPKANVGVDFGDLRLDILGHPVDVETLDQASLLAFRGMAPAEIREGLATGSLAQSDIAGWLTAYPESPFVSLHEFGTLQAGLDAQRFFVPGTTWLMLLHPEGRATAASLIFLIPDLRSPVDQVVIGDTTSHLRTDVDLLAIDPVVVAPGEVDLILDWSAVAVDGFGNSFPHASVTELFLARFDQTAEELESAVLDLEALAAESWTMQLQGSSWANLGALRGDTEFTGINEDSTWVMMLRSPGSLSPAPPLLTLLRAGP